LCVVLQFLAYGHVFKKIDLHWAMEGLDIISLMACSVLPNPYGLSRIEGFLIPSKSKFLSIYAKGSSMAWSSTLCGTFGRSATEESLNIARCHRSRSQGE
jgi:hypothetical protein